MTILLGHFSVFLLLFHGSLFTFVTAGPFASKRAANDDLPVIKHNQTLLAPLFVRPSNSTPKFTNASEINVNPLLEVADDIGLGRRQAAPPVGEGTCGPGTPCSNGACCSKEGFCGYSPDFCGTENCISNCDAQAQCGQYAPAGKEKCPLNVCCSEFGFCGTSEEFCGDGCDESGGLCGDAPPPSGKSTSLFRSIGYYESWAATRECDKVRPKDMDLTGLTHLNFAFAFFHPTTFQVSAMDGNAAGLLKDFTALRAKNRAIQTWISVGGWSFNDPGNNPDTRTAFSDMASSAANRGTFIKALMSFMQTYGFDGADIDWEYPAADDRGGKEEDKANFVLLCKEMSAAFSGRYGLSVTLPASFWYLQHFDVKAMQDHVDWFNVMTYDIHGVWDSSNRFTGPYVRPHTNLTEIDEGMSLLWRAGVQASNVVLGLGFYGRSFTLADSSCSKPGCIFKEGGKAGECTGAAGILSSAEIDRIIEDKNLTPQKDAKAAVKWITWDSDQWVSYDDAETFLQKREYASNLGLSGTMVWAIDQGTFGKTNSDYAGLEFVQKATGYGANDIETYQNYLDAGESCYVSFCGESCETGYFPDMTAQMKGQVGQLGQGSACEGDEVQNLCCKTGTFMGQCEWYGWRGQGLSCYGGTCPEGDTLITINTNHFFSSPEVDYKEDETCNGGSQVYCCRGFQPSIQNKRDPFLLSPEDLDNDPTSLAKRDFKTCLSAGVITGGGVALTLTAGGPLGWLAGLAAGEIVTAFCLISQSEASAKSLSGWSGPVTRGKIGLMAALPAGQVPPPAVPNPKGGPKQDGAKKYGRYDLATFDGQSTCSTTYTCDYGQGFDQICDNQKWGLDKVVSTRIFSYDKGGTGNGRTKQRWSSTAARNRHWYRSFGGSANSGDGGRNRCEIDEFPLNSLQESQNFAKQALRAVDGNENGRQGLDWQFWLAATWEPCSSLLGYAPPITWSIGDPGGNNDPRTAAPPGKVIARYGFDSTSGRAPCYATYTPPGAAESPVPDHGFRVLSDDPLFVSYDWQAQNYRSDPVALADGDRPSSIASGGLARRAWEQSTMTVTPIERRRTRTGDRVTAATTPVSPTQNRDVGLSDGDISSEVPPRVTARAAIRSGRLVHDVQGDK